MLFRIIQGATGGALQPLSQAVLLESFQPHERGKAMAFWALGIVVAPILGPVLGGWLTDTYSWRWVFYINLPVGIVSLLMVRAFLFDPPYIKHREGRGIDYWGIGLLAVGIGALQFVLDKGQEDDWFSSRVILTADDRRGGRAGLAHHPRVAQRRPGRRPARVPRAQLRRRRVPDDGRRASCSTAAWCCCR